MNKYYLAVDIGASSGRHMLAWLEDGLIRMEEIHRFFNGMMKKDGHLCWDYEKLFGDIVDGLKKCKELGKIPVSMGIDTWGVDYALLDAEGQVLGNTYGYRDSRTNGMDEVVSRIISPEDLYARTGIQKQMFNTIYQLMAVKVQEPQLLDAADKLLMVPDYLNYLLTGVAKCEYTEATTGQLVNPDTKDWDYELIDMLGIKSTIFEPLTTAGTRVGGLKPELVEEVGFDLDVLQIASHDTASAVMAVPSMGKETVYISSGTWSFRGVDTDAAIAKLKEIPVSLHCWQGDDVIGFDHDGPLTGGIQTTGNYPGKATTPEQLLQDMDKAMSLMPGKKKLNVHACYAIFEDGEFADRDKLEPKHFAKWVEFAKERNMGIDFNPTFFSHDKVKDGLTLSSPDEETRKFWIEHGKACIRISEYFAKVLRCGI